MDVSFETRIQFHQQALFRAALKFCHGDEAMAEDMVQDTLVKALRNSAHFSEGTNLRAWLMRILYNNVMSVYRHRQVAKEGPYPEGFDPAMESPVDFEVSDEVIQGGRDLSGGYPKDFLLARLGGHPH